MTHHLIFSLPPADLKTAFFFLRSTVLLPGGQLFKESQEVLMSFLSGILQIQSMFLFDNLSCSEIKSHISTVMSNQV
jgi:hypothetical protein